MPYKWYYDLRENTITKDVLEDYVAVPRRVVSLSPKDISQKVVDKGSEYRVETIENIIRIYEEELMEAICQGNSYVSDMMRIQPSITGIFGAKGMLDPAKNQAQVNIAPSPLFSGRVSKVELEYSGRRLIQGGAEISEVYDVTTGKTDGTVTPGDNLKILGKKIKCLNSDGTGIGKVKIINEAGSAEEIKSLAINDPSMLMFIFPTGLLAGNYTLEIETYFTASATHLLKEPRTILCPIVLKVS